MVFCDNDMLPLVYPLQKIRENDYTVRNSEAYTSAEIQQCDYCRCVALVILSFVIQFLTDTVLIFSGVCYRLFFPYIINLNYRKLIISRGNYI